MWMKSLVLFIKRQLGQESFLVAVVVGGGGGGGSGGSGSVVFAFVVEISSYDSKHPLSAESISPLNNWTRHSVGVYPERAHTQLVKEHSATVASDSSATVD